MTRDMDKTIGIAGTGAIACGLAVTAARTNDVIVWARSDESAERARKLVDKTCERLKDDDPCDTNRVEVVTDLNRFSEAGIVVEAIREDADLKRELMQKIGPVAADTALLASTTSSLSVQALADASGSPERFFGLHVFNPVPKMKLVELIFPTQASEATKASARALCEVLDKTYVEVPDLPGFVVNRLLFPAMFNAAILQEETGLESKAIDDCMQLGAGHPMGPLALLDYIGLDVCEAIGDAIGLKVPQSLRDNVAAGKLGKKTKSGYYEYD
jgi:3-hydroxybutyryl-CoA dehydrogenase